MFYLYPYYFHIQCNYRWNHHQFLLVYNSLLCLIQIRFLRLLILLIVNMITIIIIVFFWFSKILSLFTKNSFNLFYFFIFLSHVWEWYTFYLLQQQNLSLSVTRICIIYFLLVSFYPENLYLLHLYFCLYVFITVNINRFIIKFYIH